MKRKKSKKSPNLSFLFVIFFFGLFSLIIVMESLREDPKTPVTKEIEEMYKDSFVDISYEEVSMTTEKPKKANDWQEVEGTREKFWVYSAFYSKGNLRIIATTRTKSTEKIYCLQKTQNSSTVTNATIKTIRENWNLKYSAAFIICKAIPMATTVSIIKPNHQPTNELIINYPNIPKKKISLCVKPIHFNYSDSLKFLEFLEFHKIMGVSRFLFYNVSISNQISCILQNTKDVEIEMLPWKLPFLSQKEIRTEGLFAAINDCVLRERESEFLVVVDLDEMIVPKKFGNYFELIEGLGKLSGKKIGAWSFLNAFFYQMWDDGEVEFKLGDALGEKVGGKLVSLRKIRRKVRFNPQKQRSKYICNPNKVIEAGNHFIWEMSPGYFTLSVPPHMATLHHYRHACEFGGDSCTKAPSIVDKSSHQFGQKLALGVAKRIRELGVCGVFL